MTDHLDDLEAFAYRVGKSSDGQVILDEDLADRVLTLLNLSESAVLDERVRCANIVDRMIGDGEQVRFALHAIRNPRPTEDGIRDEALKLLRELYAIVHGECPSVLEEDSGGHGDLAIKIEDLLATEEREDSTRKSGPGLSPSHPVSTLSSE